jgi:hypothetical protein
MGAQQPGIIEWTRLEAEKATAPRASVFDASTFKVKMLAPPNASGTLFLLSGRHGSQHVATRKWTIERSRNRKKPLILLAYLLAIPA